jgi:hypothetical protein
LTQTYGAPARSYTYSPGDRQYPPRQDPTQQLPTQQLPTQQLPTRQPPTRQFPTRPPGDRLERTLVEPADPYRRRRRRFAILGGWALAWFAVFAPHGGYSWHYFVQGSKLLFDGAAVGAPAGGLHVYANYPQLQIGPFTFAVAQLLRQFGPNGGVFVAQLAMTALGLLVLYCVERIAAALRPDLTDTDTLHKTLLFGGGAFLIGWTDLSVAYSHLDDALALLCVTLAVWALTSRLPAIAGLCIGLSVDAKPWALVFLPLILAVPGRTRRHAAIWAAAAVIIAWAPFILADFHTLTAAQFAITNQPSSALRALGVTAPSTPSWDRTAQIALGCALGAVAVYRRRWPAVILLGIGARIVLDPGVYGYYTAGVLLGALLWDLLGMRRPIPLWTLSSGALLAVAPALITDGALLGQLRLWLVLAFTIALLLVPSHRFDDASPARTQSVGA